MKSNVKKEKRVVEVTREDVQDARHSPFSCPVAKAMNRAGFCQVSVHPNCDGKIHFSPSLHSDYKEMRLPPVARRIVNQWDRREPVEPGSFVVKW